MIPDELLYTVDHEWVRRDGDIVRVGITDYAQQALGDVVFVHVPAVGTEVVAGVACGEIESTKSVSDVFAPVSGTVVGCNDALDTNPELVNSAPYGEGWLLEIRLPPDAAPVGLLSAGDYREHIA